MNQPPATDPSTAPGPRAEAESIQRAVADALDKCSLGAFSSVAELREIVSKRRGRAVEALPFPLRGTNISGLLLVTPEADLIVYEQEAPVYHQEHTQLHELSHILLGHVDTEAAAPAEALAQLPSLCGHTVVKAFQRTDYAEQMELEAETLATLLAIRLRTYATVSRPQESEELKRIDRSLSRREG